MAAAQQQFILSYATDGGADVENLPPFPDEFNDNHHFCDLDQTHDRCCIDGTQQCCDSDSCKPLPAGYNVADLNLDRWKKFERD
jgi:hypothetical protein